MLLGLIAAVTLALGLSELRYGLPAVLHSDFVQARQAVELLRTGSIVDFTIYPATLALGYATCDVVAFGVGNLLGWSGYASWEEFLRHLARLEVHHAIGRAFGALAAALLGLAVYRLARVRFDRRVALLAAAIASFCPLQTLYAHQVRPHVPVITLLVMFALPMLRIAQRPGTRRALTAGLAAGLVNGVFQVGMPMLATTLLLLAIFVRPLRAQFTQGLAATAGFVFAWQGLTWTLQGLGLIVKGGGSGLMGQTLESGLGFGVHDVFDDLGRFPEVWAQWFTTDPLRAVAVIAFLGLCLARKRRWRDALLYGAFPLVTLASIVLVMGARPRYAMYATPFLAVLAASAVMASRRRTLRVVLAALLVLVPLATSVRMDRLLARGDTRISVLQALSNLEQPGLSSAIQADLAPSGIPLPPRAKLFPPRGRYARWMRGKGTPAETLAAIAPDVFVREFGAGGPLVLGVGELRRAGFVRIGLVGSKTSFQPDEPARIWPDIWLAARPGPAVEVWARRNVAATALAALPESLFSRTAD